MPIASKLLLLHLLNVVMGEFGLQLLLMLTLVDFFTSCEVCLASLYPYSAYLQHDSVPTTSPNSHQSHFASCSVKNGMPAIFSVLYAFCLFPESEGHKLAEGGEESHGLSCRSD